MSDIIILQDTDCGSVIDPVVDTSNCGLITDSVTDITDLGRDLGSLLYTQVINPVSLDNVFRSIGRIVTEVLSYTSAQNSMKITKFPLMNFLRDDTSCLVWDVATQQYVQGVLFSISPTPADANIVITIDETQQSEVPVIVKQGQEVSYTVSRDGYISQSGTMTVNSNTNLNITLSVLTWNTLTISPTPSDATVTLTADGYTQEGNSITVPYGTQVSYTVSKTGYVADSHTVTVITTNTINVVLAQYFTLTISPTPSDATVTLTAAGYTQEGNSITVPTNTVVSYYVSADNYIRKQGTVTVTYNQTLSVSLSKMYKRKIAFYTEDNVIPNNISILTYTDSTYTTLTDDQTYVENNVIYSNKNSTYVEVSAPGYATRRLQSPLIDFVNYNSTYHTVTLDSPEVLLNWPLDKGTKLIYETVSNCHIGNEDGEFNLTADQTITLSAGYYRICVVAGGSRGLKWNHIRYSGASGATIDVKVYLPAGNYNVHSPIIISSASAYDTSASVGDIVATSTTLAQSGAYTISTTSCGYTIAQTFNRGDGSAGTSVPESDTSKLLGATSLFYRTYGGFGTYVSYDVGEGERSQNTGCGSNLRSNDKSTSNTSGYIRITKY